MDIIKENKFLLLLKFLILILIAIFGLLYKEKYLNCLTKDFIMCLTSNKYISKSGKFSFRYPKKYPVTFKTGNELLNQYNFDNNYVEWVNFSREFYPNAGGDRLGAIIVEKNISYQSINQFIDQILYDFNKSSKQYKKFQPQIEYLKISGKNAAKIIKSRQSYNLTPSKNEYVIIHNKYLYIIDFYYDEYYHKLPKEYYQKGEQLILSTFTFND